MNNSTSLGLGAEKKNPMIQILRIDRHHEDPQKTDDVRTFYTARSGCKPIVEAICDTALLRECKSEERRFLDISERFVALRRVIVYDKVN